MQPSQRNDIQRVPPDDERVFDFVVFDADVLWEHDPANPPVMPDFLAHPRLCQMSLHCEWILAAIEMLCPPDAIAVKVSEKNLASCSHIGIEHFANAMSDLVKRRFIRIYVDADNPDILAYEPLATTRARIRIQPLRRMSWRSKQSPGPS